MREEASHGYFGTHCHLTALLRSIKKNRCRGEVPEGEGGREGGCHVSRRRHGGAGEAGACRLKLVLQFSRNGRGVSVSSIAYCSISFLTNL
ncbi:hypothetical protein E2C01_082056 [Portunus trituberculatus]|uniref:Uncharacterized protein n=1 Tax=Portunus trituberculatus TaxID=210409 RepID=A0A5B7IRD3_PORTR|nr:hypothetical protein [Portunus trituberculatus]